MSRLKWEIVIVLALSYGMSALYSVARIANRLLDPAPLSTQTATLNRPLASQEFFDLVFQILGVASGLAPVALVLWLVWRDRKPHFADLGLGWLPGERKLGKELLTGIGLAAAIGIPGIAVYLGARALNLGVTIVPTELDAHWWTVPVLLLWALRAGLGEEIVVVGYLFHRLRQLGWSPWIIVISAALLRGTYHLYQGFGGFVGNIAMGIIFGAIYLRTKRLLPLITAHVVIDMVAFVGYPTAVVLFPDVFA